MDKNVNGCKIALATLIGISLLACNPTNQSSKTIHIANPSSLLRAEVASIPYAAFRQAHNKAQAFKIIDREGREYAYQIEKGAGDSIENVLVWVEIPANDEVDLLVQEGDPTPVAAKTFARYIPERFDDFAWENDKIAFRMYGKALEGRADDAQGTDIWAKRTDKLVIDEWYKTGDYHKDHGDGLDYYAVGMTLGAGDIAPYVNNKIIYSKHYRDHEVLENGPLRSKFKLTYEPWEVDGKQVSVTKTITLDAGAQLNRVEVVYHLDGGQELPVVAGIVLRKEEGAKVIQLPEKNIAAYWEPAHGDDGTLGIAILGESPITGITENEGQLLVHFRAEENKALVYYNGGAWDKAEEIASAEEWERYLTDFQEKLTNPLKIVIK